jgi:hypothetical protein
MRFVLCAALLFVTSAVLAQRVPAGLPGLGAHKLHGDSPAADAADAATAVQGAVNDGGKRDGDDQLTCEQLQAELGTLQADPSMQALTGQLAGTDAAATLAAAQQMMQQQMANRPSVAKAMAQSLNPFGAKKRAEKQQAEIEAQTAEMRKAMGNQPQLADGKGGGVGAGIDPNSPQMLRAGRLLELSQQKKCDAAAIAQPQPGPAAQPAQPTK